MVETIETQTQTQTYWGTDLTSTEAQALEAPQKNKLFLLNQRSLEYALYALTQFALTHGSSKVLLYVTGEWREDVQDKLSECLINRGVRSSLYQMQTKPYLKILLKNNAEIWYRDSSHSIDLLRGFEFDLIVVFGVKSVYQDPGPGSISTLKGLLLGMNPTTNQPRTGQFWLFAHPHESEWLAEEWEKGNLLEPRDHTRNLSIREPNPFR